MSNTGAEPFVVDQKRGRTSPMLDLTHSPRIIIDHITDEHVISADADDVEYLVARCGKKLRVGGLIYDAKGELRRIIVDTHVRRITIDVRGVGLGYTLAFDRLEPCEHVPLPHVNL